MLRRLSFPLALLLSGCGSWPDVPQSDFARSNEAWPQLMPIEQIGQVPTGEDPDAIREELAARTAALNARAAILRRPAVDADAMEALRQRLAR